MFYRNEVESILALQEKAYRLLRWAGLALNKGTLRFDVMHTALSTCT